MNRYYGKLQDSSNKHEAIGMLKVLDKEGSTQNIFNEVYYFKRDLSTDPEPFINKSCSLYFCHLKIPGEFHNVIITKDINIPDYNEEKFDTALGNIWVKRKSIGKDISGFFAINISFVGSKSHYVYGDNEGKEYPIVFPGEVYNGAGTRACPLTIAYNGIKPKIFKFRHHYFLPLLLTNGTICYYAVENKVELKKWINTVHKFYSPRSSGGLHSHYPLLTGVKSDIIYDNILGIHLTKEANLYIPEKEEDIIIKYSEQYLKGLENKKTRQAE